MHAAAKAGVEAFAESMRKELRRTIVTVRPGAVKTDMWKDVPFKMSASAMETHALAEMLLEAYECGEKGPLLDL